tara:strand:+ start:129 stop:980 length:852 start_codon:yes stop_codon:yes gene_type:complete
MSDAMEALARLQALLGNSLAEAGQALSAYLPSLLTALLLLLMGWLLGRLIQTLIMRFGHGIDRLMAWLHHQTVPAAQPPANPPSTIFARVLFWVVLLLFAAAAAEALGLPGLGDWVGRIVQYLPNVITCIVIILLGFPLAGFAQNLVYQIALEQSFGSARLLGRTVQLLVITLAGVLGISQLAVDISLLINLITLAAASVLGGLGLAFGLGARQQVSNILAAQNLRSLYQPGQRIRVEGVEGDIIELTSKAVIVKTSSGLATIPARFFSEQVVLLLLEDDANG